MPSFLLSISIFRVKISQPCYIAFYSLGGLQFWRLLSQAGLGLVGWGRLRRPLWIIKYLTVCWFSGTLASPIVDHQMSDRLLVFWGGEDLRSEGGAEDSQSGLVPTAMSASPERTAEPF
jgi:hypothetical protein